MNGVLVAKRLLSGEVRATRAQRKRASDLERRDLNINDRLQKVDTRQVRAQIKGMIGDWEAQRAHASRRHKRRAAEAAKLKKQLAAKQRGA